ncbi:MAG: Mth938-like domain-containing protein [Planctomycetota bacterium]|jgi:hypothetical protein
MSTPAPSPTIARLTWGHLEVEGRERPYKDAKLFPGGSRAWDWNETATSHDPGIQPADVEELLEHGATVVVLATGMYQRLGVCPETLRLLEQKNVPVHVLQTEKAVRRYNELIETEAAGALIHSTC